MNEKHITQRGSALVYILIAIALLAALTVTFMQPSSQQATSQRSFESFTALKSQIDFIRSSVQECVLVYQSGDSNLIGTPNFPYPINPSSSFYDGFPDSPNADNDEVRNVRCPGNPGNSKNHADIFVSTMGKFLAPPPDLFEEFQYYNGTDGVFFYTQTDKSDAFLQTAMAKLDDEFAECEADVIDASAAQREMTSTEAGTDPKCPLGSTCFRVWMVIQPSATDAYKGDTEGDEVSCP